MPTVHALLRATASPSRRLVAAGHAGTVRSITSAAAARATRMGVCRPALVPAVRHGGRSALRWEAAFPVAPSSRRALSSDKAAPPENKQWSFEEVQKLSKDADSPVVLIDVREPAELAASGRIPGAINIPVTSAPDSFFLSDEDFEERFGFVRPARDAEVVFYCKAGVRSRAAAGLARDAGWTHVGEYPGSWVDWYERGGAIERS